MNELIKILIALSTQAKVVADGRAARKAIVAALVSHKAVLKEHCRKIGRDGWAAFCKEHAVHAVVSAMVRRMVWPVKLQTFKIDSRLGAALEKVVPADREQAMAFLRSLSKWVSEHRAAEGDEKE